MRLAGTALLLALAACNAWRGVVPGSPDYTAPSGPRVWMDGQPGQPESIMVLECIHDRMWLPSMCPIERLPAALERWKRLRVHWAPDPFFCLSIYVHGCVTNEAEVYVSSLAVLADESGHVAWDACGRGWGEYRDGGRVIYDGDFAAWVSPCRP